MKKLIFMILLFILIPLIYFCAYNEKKQIFTIGNNRGNIFYIPNYNRITDIIIDIENNIDIADKKIQNILIKSSSIELDLRKYLNFKDYNSLLDEINNVEILINTIRKYSKEQIIIKLLDEKNILYEYANKKILLMAQKYDIMVVR